MKVKDLMSKNPACATQDMPLERVARMMADENVGAIPIVDNQNSMKIKGVVTDRDIATRAVAKGQNPVNMKAGDIMSSPVFTAREEDDVEEVTRLMEKNRVRRVPVVDNDGHVRGMVAQADIALRSSHQTTAEVVQEISKPDDERSQRR